MKILFLYSELGPYNIAVLRALSEAFGAEVHVVHWSHRKLTPFVPADIARVHYYARSDYDAESLSMLAEAIRPDLAYISGWMDPAYFAAARRIRARRKPVVSGFDAQWSGSLRQVLGWAAMPFYYRRMISHAWVAGPRQYEYARRLGFDATEIVFDLLSCDHELFDRAAERRASSAGPLPRSFLYVGRFSAEKGLEVLLDAFRDARRANSAGWNLVCVGNGPLKDQLACEPGVEVKDYVAQDSLAAICATAGVFVMPSLREGWGVAVHEAAAAGLPVILTTAVGSAATFLIPGLNGLSCEPGSRNSLARAMGSLMRMPDEGLREMGKQSRVLARRITPQTSAASLLSIPAGVGK